MNMYVLLDNNECGTVMHALQDNVVPFFVYRLIKIKEWVDKYDPGALVIPFSGALELKLQELSAEERQKYLEANMTQRLISIHSFSLHFIINYFLAVI